MVHPAPAPVNRKNTGVSEWLNARRIFLYDRYNLLA
jgi:hypothetical protein